MDNFSIGHEHNGEVTVVKVAGRVDSITAATMDAELEKVTQEHKKIVIDLKDASYLSSAGVRAILKASQNVQKAGGGVRLANIPALVRDVLENVGVMEILKVYATVDEAVASF